MCPHLFTVSSQGWSRNTEKSSLPKQNHDNHKKMPEEPSDDGLLFPFPCKVPEGFCP